jgi:uncharacterized protein HemX
MKKIAFVSIVVLIAASAVILFAQDQSSTTTQTLDAVNQQAVVSPLTAAERSALILAQNQEIHAEPGPLTAAERTALMLEQNRNTGE